MISSTDINASKESEGWIVNIYKVCRLTCNNKEGTPKHVRVLTKQAKLMFERSTADKKENRLYLTSQIPLQIAQLCSGVTVLDCQRTVRRIPEIEKLLRVLDWSNSTTYCVSSVTASWMEYARQESKVGITTVAQNCLSKS